jgi:hypothetical protein
MAADCISRSRPAVTMYKRNAKQSEIGIHDGRAHGLASLADARAAAARFRDMLAQGLDPKVAKRPATTMTFADCVREVLKIKNWRHPKTAHQWRMTLTNYCLLLQDMPVGEITKDHIVACLQPLWTTRQSTAMNLRGRMEYVLAWATAKKHRHGDNPARWQKCLEFELSAPTVSTKHHKAMDWRSVPSFVSQLREQESVARLALDFSFSLPAD